MPSRVETGVRCDVAAVHTPKTSGSSWMPNPLATNRYRRSEVSLAIQSNSPVSDRLTWSPPPLWSKGPAQLQDCAAGRVSNGISSTSGFTVIIRNPDSPSPLGLPTEDVVMCSIPIAVA
jgi:hypothetical protein